VYILARGDVNSKGATRPFKHFHMKSSDVKTASSHKDTGYP